MGLVLFCWWFLFVCLFKGQQCVQEMESRGEAVFGTKRKFELCWVEDGWWFHRTSCWPCLQPQRTWNVFTLSLFLTSWLCNRFLSLMFEIPDNSQASWYLWPELKRRLMKFWMGTLLFLPWNPDHELLHGGMFTINKSCLFGYIEGLKMT